MRIKIKKGLDIPLAGEPEQVIDEAVVPQKVAAVATDVAGIRPRMAVNVGDRVRVGDVLFHDKRNPEIPFVSPGCGEVVEINRGAKRALQSVVIRLDGDDAVTFPTFEGPDIPKLDSETVRKHIIDSSIWTTFRTRPFGRIPAPGAVPAAIFVTAIDTRPLAADPAVVISAYADAFQCGLQALPHLTGGKVYVCTAPDSGIQVPDNGRFVHAEFEGPHPAGLVGTHIHFLEPVSMQKTVWHIGYQHVIGIGRLLTEGRLPTQRVIAVGGPRALRPRLLRTRIGAHLPEVLKGEIGDGRVRIVSGSVLGGHHAIGPLAYLGRYHNQITLLKEGSEREFLSWMRPGLDKYSESRAYAGHLKGHRRVSLTSSQNGSPRAMVPIGSFERIMPLDILATPLLKALLVRDTDRAQELGCLELDEEDLALCSFVCNGKYEYGPHLRVNLDEIEVNG